MAKVVENFHNQVQGGTSKYESLSDGKIWELDDTDLSFYGFTKMDRLREALKQFAKNRGLKMRSQKTPSGTLQVQMLKVEGDPNAPVVSVPDAQ